MKLELQLIPASSFCSNLRNHIGQDKWTLLSKKIRNEHKRKCQICGWQESYTQRQYTHLHEVWSFDMKTGIQKLVGFECICPTCHNVHHWGCSELRGEDMDKLIAHACRINKCTRIEWMAYVDKSFREWSKRSDIEWNIDLGGYNGL